MDCKLTTTQNPVVCYERAHQSNNGVQDVLNDPSFESQSLNSLPEDSENTRGNETLPLGCPESPTTKSVSRIPLIKLWFVLILTTGFAVVLLVASHLTHSLTLKVEAYHAIYNMMALGGCLFTIKISEGPATIKNTFGWVRIELLFCLCSLLFIASLCFSVALETIRTASHANHQEQDAMHHPLYIIGLGGIGLILNAVVFCLIGGYTHHQGCFLEHRTSGVWVQSRVPEHAVQAGMRALLSGPFEQHPTAEATLHRSYQGWKGILRDICGLVVVMLCASIVLWDTRETLSLYIDPLFAMISVSVLLFLSYPFGKECCQILLQTIPGNIDVQTLSAKLLEEFPEVVNVHHLHIWSLTPGKVIATAHVVYTSPKIYRQSVHALEQFFIDKDINQVTLQPEFVHYASTLPSEVGSNECLLRCTNNLCRQKECCNGCQTVVPEAELELEEEGPVEPLLVGNLQYRLTAQSNLTSRESNVQGEQHHGVAAYRKSCIDLPLRAECSRKSRSRDDLVHGARDNMHRSHSCNVLMLEKRELLKDSILKT